MPTDPNYDALNVKYILISYGTGKESKNMCHNHTVYKSAEITHQLLHASTLAHAT